MKVISLAKLLPLAGAVLLAGCKAHDASPPATFQVFSSQAECVARHSDTEFCRGLEERAQFVASHLVWKFWGLKDCAQAYGSDQCLQDPDGEWRVKMAGFTLFGLGDNVNSALPVFSSSVYPGYYLPNGYPVLMGVNSVAGNILASGAFVAGRPRSLGDELCVKEGGKLQCAPLHEQLSLRLEKPLVAAIFQGE